MSKSNIIRIDPFNLPDIPRQKRKAEEALLHSSQVKGGKVPTLEPIKDLKTAEDPIATLPQDVKDNLFIAPQPKPEDYPAYSPALELDEDGKPFPQAIQDRNPHGNLDWALKEIKQDRGKLRMRFPPWNATIVAHSENGMSSGKVSNKTYLRLEDIKDSKHYTIKQFIDNAKVLMDQIIWLSRYEVVKYQKAIEASTGKSLPAIAIDPTVPCSQEYWDGNVYYSCFPNQEKTQAFVFDSRSEFKENWTNTRELGVSRFLMVTGNSTFKVTISINSAEFFYDKTVNAIKFTWWPQVQVVTHFNKGQDVMYRPPKKDKAVPVNQATELSENVEIAKLLETV